MNELIPMEEMYPLIAEMLDIKGEVAFTVSGWSMQPMIYHRRDTVTLVKPKFPLRKYDLPFYKMDDGRFILHRVIKVYKDGTYKCQGDNRWEPEDNICNDQIIGIVKSFNRNGKQIDVDKSFGYWLYTRTWKFFHHFKWMYNFPKRTKAKFQQRIEHFKITRKLRKKVKITFKGGKNMNIEYRAATASDLKDFYRLYENFAKQEGEVYQNPVTNPQWITTEPAKQYYNKLRQNHFFWLAVHNGEIIGFCTGSTRKIEPRNIVVGELVKIYVDERYRSMGIGTELVNTFKAFCKEKNCTNITVTFMEKNERAEKFYARHGFGEHKRTYICSTE